MHLGSNVIDTRAYTRVVVIALASAGARAHAQVVSRAGMRDLMNVSFGAEDDLQLL